MDKQLQLATCSYKEFRPDMGRAVRITYGRPRWALAYPLVGHARLLTPTGPMLKMPLDAYTLAFHRMLNAAGVDAIRAELAAFAAGQDKPLVLLCFERLDQPGEGCHRTDFAAWWREQTGEIVPELGAHAPARGHAPHHQPTLLDAE